MLVIDGNMKNRRDVCAATKAGYIEYEGLPEVIITGCQQTPGHQSKYCYSHAPRISKMEVETDPLQEEGIVQLIMAKKSTRSGTYYQVRSYRESIRVL